MSLKMASTTINTALQPDNHVYELEKLATDDQDAMHAIGKQQVFKRKFNFLSALGFTVCISATVRFPNMHQKRVHIADGKSSGRVFQPYCFKHLLKLALLVSYMAISSQLSLWRSLHL